jgi:hypothetical protein
MMHGNTKRELLSLLANAVLWVTGIAARHGRFIPVESASDTSCVWGWVGHRVALDVDLWREIYCGGEPNCGL